MSIHQTLLSLRCALQSYLKGFGSLDDFFGDFYSRVWDVNLDSLPKELSEIIGVIALLHAEWTNGHRSNLDAVQTLMAANDTLKTTDWAALMP